MKIRIVKTRRDMKKFINFPYSFYKNDEFWVPPLRMEMRNQFSLKTNPFLDHCDWQLFLLEEDGVILGRIAAFIDKLAIDFWGDRIGLFGYFECTQNESAAKLLLDAVKDWLIEKNCTAMRGPWSFVSQEWGSVVEGFSPQPVIMGPYNPPYYNDFYTSYGLEKSKDLLCWYIAASEGYQIPERIKAVTDKVANRYKVSVRTVNMKNYAAEVRRIMNLSNRSIINNWGYSPVTDAEVEAMAHDLKSVVHPEGVLFAVDEEGNEIGFAIALPDINVLLKNLNGRLFPLGIFKLLVGLPKLRQYRMFALGVVPEYQGKAVDSLLYRALNEKLYSPELRVEINYVLEDNWPMINAIKKLNATPLRRYRIFEMSI